MSRMVSAPVSRSDEQVTKGRLESLRAALNIYYGESAGQYPPRLDDSAFLRTQVGERALPEVRLKHHGHPPSNTVEAYPFTGADAKVDPARLRDTGHWLYDAATGLVIVDCTHPGWDGRPVWLGTQSGLGKDR